MHHEGPKGDVEFSQEINRFDFPEKYKKHLETVRSGEFTLSPLTKPEGWDSFTPDEKEFHNLTLAIALTPEPEQERDDSRRKLLSGIRDRATELAKRLSIERAEKIAGKYLAVRLFYGRR